MVQIMDPIGFILLTNRHPPFLENREQVGFVLSLNLRE